MRLHPVPGIIMGPPKRHGALHSLQFFKGHGVGHVQCEPPVCTTFVGTCCIIDDQMCMIHVAHFGNSCCVLSVLSRSASGDRVSAVFRPIYTVEVMKNKQGSFFFISFVLVVFATQVLRTSQNEFPNSPFTNPTFSPTRLMNFDSFLDAT